MNEETKMKHYKLLEVWYKARDEKQLRVKYPLNKDSVIFDVGAYHGTWAKQMHELYGCTIYCFEPVPASFRKLKEIESDQIICYQFGLGDSERAQMIEFDKDASSLFLYSDGSKNGVRVHIRTMDFVLSALNLESVDLIKINIEGAEYELLEHIIENDLLGVFKHVQIQFHRNVPDYERRRDKIRAALSKTHEEMYNYDFIWESWRIKE